MGSDVKVVLQTAQGLVVLGWCQGAPRTVGQAKGAYSRHRGPSVVVRHIAPANELKECYCMSGAISLAAGDDNALFDAATHAVAAVLPPGTSVARWNDHPHRKLSNVLAVFGRAIGRLS